jgi:hypothetical protein
MPWAYTQNARKPVSTLWKLTRSTEPASDFLF